MTIISTTNYLGNQGVSFISLYKKNGSFFYRLLRRLCFTFGFGLLFFNLNQIKGSRDNCYLVFDSGITASFLRWLKKNKPNARLIFWYANMVSDSFPFRKIPSGFEKWSYSRFDCQKYGMEWNSQFFLPDYISTLLGESPSFDITFVGKDKGRKKYILFLEKYLIERGFTTSFLIVDSRPFNFLKKQSGVTYSRYLQLENQGRAILDVTISRFSGVSRRPLEAAYMGRKIITNCEEISQYSFYNKDDIFILKENDFSGLDLFLQNPKKAKYGTSVLEYSLFNWCRRFNSVNGEQGSL